MLHGRGFQVGSAAFGNIQSMRLRQDDGRVCLNNSRNSHKEYIGVWGNSRTSSRAIFGVSGVGRKLGLVEVPS